MLETFLVSLYEKLYILPVFKNVDRSADIANNTTMIDPHAKIYHRRDLVVSAPEIYFYQGIKKK